MPTCWTHRSLPELAGLPVAAQDALWLRAWKRVPRAVTWGWRVPGALGAGCEALLGAWVLGNEARLARVLLCGASAGIAALLGTPFRIRMMRPYLRRELGAECPACGYSLVGNLSGVCPECGTPIGSHSEPEVASRVGLGN